MRDYENLAVRIEMLRTGVEVKDIARYLGKDVSQVSRTLCSEMPPAKQDEMVKTVRRIGAEWRTR